MMNIKVFNFERSVWQNREVEFTPLNCITSIRITPQQAEILLRNNHNRVLNKAKTNQYARDIKSGNWTCSNDAICFDINGVLLNGQHRLSGCVEAQSPIEVLVSFGMSEENQQVMDCGKNRTLHDVATLSGRNITAKESGIITYVRDQTFLIKGQKRSTRQECLELIDTYRQELHDVHECLYPSNLKKEERTALRIGNDVGAAIFRAWVNYKDTEQLSRLKQFIEILVVRKTMNRIFGADKFKTECGHIRASIMRKFYFMLENRSKSYRGGQDGNGRDYYYRLTEKAIMLFINPPPTFTLIRTDKDELFKLKEEIKCRK